MLRFGLAELAHGLALCGSGSEAAEMIAEIDALPSSASARMFPESIVGARAWTAVAQGDLDTAMRTLRDGAGDAACEGGLALEMMALHDLARLGGPGEVVDRIETLAADLDGPLARARADHVRALVDEDPEALDAASRSFEALGCILLGAEAAAGAATAALGEWEEPSPHPQPTGAPAQRPRRALRALSVRLT